MSESFRFEKPPIETIAVNVFEGMLRNQLLTHPNGLTIGDIDRCIDKTIDTLITQGDLPENSDTAGLRNHLRKHLDQELSSSDEEKRAA